MKLFNNSISRFLLIAISFQLMSTIFVNSKGIPTDRQKNSIANHNDYVTTPALVEEDRDGEVDASFKIIGAAPLLYTTSHTSNLAHSQRIIVPRNACDNKRLIKTLLCTLLI